jgi:hypothetical protein
MWSATSYTFSLKCKTGSGVGTVTFSVSRLGAGGQNSTGTATCTNSWSTISLVFAGSETSSTATAAIEAKLSFSQGTLFKITDTYLGQTTYNSSNPTIYNDNYVNGLKAYAGDTLRLWDGQTGETLDDWIKPAWGRHSSGSVQNGTYFNATTVATGLYDHLLLCQTIGVHTCTVVVPASWTDADYQHLIQFIAGNSGTYPAKRNALDALSGRANGPFSSSIPQIVVELTNEPWNTAFPGENMPDIGDGYQQIAYGMMASRAFADIKSDSTYVSNVKLAINCQTASYVPCVVSVLPQVSNADMIVLSNYFGSTLNTLDTLQDEFNPQSGFAFSNANDTSSNGWVRYFEDRVKSAFPGYPFTYGIYTGGSNTSGGTATSTQINAHNEAMINAAEIVQGYMETMKELGITVQSVFESAQDLSGTGQNPIWGIFKDPDGGQLSGQGNYYFRQVGLGVQIANQCIGQGGTMYGATVSGETTYSTSALNGWPAWSNLPYLTAYAFENGNNRCLLFANTDPVNPATVSITGTNAPSAVTENLLLGGSIAANNEGTTPGVTIQTTSAKPITPTYSIPPYSVSAISWAVLSATSISNVQASGVNQTAATITWTTNNPATSLVAYGKTSANGSTSPLNSTLVTSHSVSLSGLTSGTVYNFTVSSTDGNGNTIVSSNYSFSTLPAAPVISNIRVSPATTSATITWTTSTPATSQVVYTANTASSSPLNTSLVLAHSVALTGLTAGTKYTYIVESADASGTQASSAASVFTTTTATSVGTPSVTASGSAGAGGSVRSITTGTGGTAFSCAAGSAAVAFVNLGLSGAKTTVSDSARNNGWAPYGSQYSGQANAGYGQWFYNPHLSSGITSVTATWSSGHSYVSLIAHCITGLAAGRADFSQATSATPNAASVSGGAFTTSASPEIVFMGIGTGGAASFTPAAGWTSGLSQVNGSSAYTEYQVFSSIQTGQKAQGSFSASTSQNTITIGLK